MQKIIVMCLCIMLLVGTASAATVWNPAAHVPPIVPPDVGNWNDAGNWNNGIPGVIDPKAVLNLGAAAAECQVTDTQGCVNVVIGDGGPGGDVLRIIDGGNLTTTSWLTVGWSQTGQMIVEEGGVVNIGGHMWMAAQPAPTDCILDINGGTVNVGQNVGLGTVNGNDPSGGTAFINVNAGVLNLHHWNDPGSIQDGSVLDIRYGTVNITNDGDQSDEAQAYADVGKITAFGGTGTLNIVHVGSTTTITAIGGMDPWPVGITVPTGNVELSWTNLDPNNPADPVYVDVWFGTDPNKLGPNYVKVISAILPAGEDANSVIVNAPATGTYYWQVDSYIWGSGHINDANMIESNVWSFVASDDAQPENVNAGVNMMTWANRTVQLGGPVQLGGTYDDDGASTVDVTWSSSDLNAVFSPSTDGGATSTAVNPTVTVDYAAGAVTLTFTVQDQLNPAVSDDMIVTVYADRCQAARVGANRAVNYPGDFTGPEGVPDCIVDFIDLAEEIADKWLINYELTEPVPKPVP